MGVGYGVLTNGGVKEILGVELGVGVTVGVGVGVGVNNVIVGLGVGKGVGVKNSYGIYFSDIISKFMSFL